MRLDLEQLDAHASFTALGVALGLACWIASCGKGATEEPGPAPVLAPALAPPRQASPTRAGSQLCADCHEEVVESWSHTGMARALGPIDPSEFAGLEQVPDAPVLHAYVARLGAEWMRRGRALDPY